MLSLLFLLPAVLAFPNSGPRSAAGVHSLSTRALRPYAPEPAACPSDSLVRQANGVNSNETSYINARYVKASIALAQWLAKNGDFGLTSNYPTVALATSGGGLRSLLTGGGVVQAFDSRDSNVSTSGLYQALTYESGLSGGSWLLNSLAGNNWPTVSDLRDNVWGPQFQDSLLVPENFLSSVAYAEITADTLSKQAAGYEVTVVDPYGRILGYELLEGANGGVTDTMSGLSVLSNFTSHNVPFPLTTAIGVLTSEGQCLPPGNGTQYEFSPYEFGSWDQGVSAFVQMKYVGTNLTGGVPTSGNCTVNYDNLGFIMGTSGDVFAELCPGIPNATNSTTELVDDLEAIVDQAHAASTTDLYALYPNPFYHYPGSYLVSNDTELSLVDGGLSDENDPIWPFLHRSVDVLIVNDNSADTEANYPNGTGLYKTYLEAQQQGFSSMPVIPTPAVFVANGYNVRPTFFGCNTTSTLTIIYIPNTMYTYDSGQLTTKVEYTEAETDAMIANGVEVGDYGGSSTWGVCLGCAIMKKTGASLPGNCTECFSNFCHD